ncbi:MAG: hypothetical protein GY894_03550 [Planctomycetes bacterium]|nr:hypothetical protein [Planctomycetota bacterium]MCP4838424.1 hypothetical protein [Planctomycetota bacterium]
MTTLGSILIAVFALIGSSTGAPPPDPCKQVMAPPIVIDDIHEGPIEIAIAWHVPGSSGRALSPPLEAHGMICDGTSVLSPRMLQSDDLITQGALTNTGESLITILTTEGEIIDLPPGRSLWVGSLDMLSPTHHCICECMCTSWHGSYAVTFTCEDGQCPNNGTRCKNWYQGGLEEGTLNGCHVIYVPKPSPDVLDP